MSLLTFDFTFGATTAYGALLLLSNCGVICINFISGCVQSAKIQRETPRIYVTVINVDTMISLITTNLSIAPSVNPIINFKVRTFS